MTDRWEEEALRFENMLKAEVKQCGALEAEVMALRAEVADLKERHQWVRGTMLSYEQALIHIRFIIDKSIGSYNGKGHPPYINENTLTTREDGTRERLAD